MSKALFRTHSVDLRVQDVKKITSLVKSWLYQDQLLKPEEIILYRPPSLGGLGLLNIQLKAQAGLIRTFLETAVNPAFRTSQYHSILFRYHVLGDDSLHNPGFPPFYSAALFAKIRQVHDESPLNVAKMTERQWYQLLLEDTCTMEEMDGGHRRLIQCRVERINPETDWERSWRLARLPGLGPENTSFLFKMMHHLLPTQERVSKTKPGSVPACPMAGCAEQHEDLPHALVLCQGNSGVGQRVLECLKDNVAAVEVDAALRLEFEAEQDMELPLVWLLATVFLTVWTLRLLKAKIQLNDFRSQIEAKINLLRETRYRNSAGILDQLVKKYF